VAVCSAATKSSAITTLHALLGKERFDALDLFMAGDDVDKKKPDPLIYRLAAERLNVHPGSCVVIEDSMIGLAVSTDSFDSLPPPLFCLYSAKMK
jgi:HAD superfamily hydrolase (TIGR01509 family)